MCPDGTRQSVRSRNLEVTLNHRPILRANPCWGLRVSRPTGQGVRVAVVDSGLNSDSERTSPQGKTGIAVDPRSGDLLAESPLNDTLGHGTLCSRQIAEIAPAAELVPVKVFHKVLEASPRAIETAVYAAADCGVHVINMSLATSREDVVTPWYAACQYAAARGIAVIAAASSSFGRSFPANFDCVIGVRYGSLSSPYSYSFDPSSDCECTAWGYPLWRDPLKSANKCPANSIASATVAGLVSLLLEQYRPASVVAVRRLLERFSS